MAIETRIAKASYSQVQLRDIDKNYHKMSYNQLVIDYPGIDWGNVFLASGFPAFKDICVAQPEPIHEVEKILAETSLDDLKTYEWCAAGPSSLEACCEQRERCLGRGHR